MQLGGLKLNPNRGKKNILLKTYPIIFFGEIFHQISEMDQFLFDCIKNWLIKIKKNRNFLRIPLNFDGIGMFTWGIFGHGDFQSFSSQFPLQRGRIP